MEKIYSNRKIIAKITLVSVLVFLFIAINYKIFGVRYSEGSYEEGILRNTLSIDNSMPEKSLNVAGNHGLNKFLNNLPDLINSITEVMIKSALILITIYLTRVSINKKDDDTLVSLCVRMDE